MILRSSRVIPEYTQGCGRGTPTTCHLFIPINYTKKTLTYVIYKRRCTPNDFNIVIIFYRTRIHPNSTVFDSSSLYMCIGSRVEIKNGRNSSHRYRIVNTLQPIDRSPPRQTHRKNSR